jgi:hypothetical protein
MGRERTIAAVVCLLLLAAYIAAGLNDLRRYLVTGEGVPGVRAAADRGDWRLPRVLEVSAVVDQIANAGDEVASFWPGDIYQTHANPVSGFENPFGLPISERLSSEQRGKYHLLSPVEVTAGFAGHVPRVVVLRNQIISPSTDQRNTNVWDNGDSFRRSLLDNGYHVDRSFGGISIYVFGGNDARN